MMCERYIRVVLSNAPSTWLTSGYDEHHTPSQASKGSDVADKIAEDTLSVLHHCLTITPNVAILVSGFRPGLSYELKGEERTDLCRIYARIMVFARKNRLAVLTPSIPGVSFSRYGSYAASSTWVVA